MFKRNFFFIVFEGIEGTGKSFQINKLVNNLTVQKDPRMFGSEIFDSYPRISTMRNFQGFNERGEYNEKYKN